MRARKTLLWMFVRIPLLLAVLSAALVTVLRWVPVRYTPVMLKRQVQAARTGEGRPRQEWVPLERMSPELVKAVTASEDQRFLIHHGFDLEEVRTVLDGYRREGTPIRGCSTISQQTAKNVFTFGTPTVLRKVSEAWWTVLIEAIWGKRRIMEVYLNVAETGSGLFGMQAASLHYFGVPAERLDLKRAASLAVCLPCPLAIRPDCPGPYERGRMKMIMACCGE